MSREKAPTQAGFTLLETMIAMVVLAFGLLTLAMMQLEAVTQGAAGRHTSDAAAVGRTYLEQVQRVPWTELDAAQAAAGWVAPAWQGAQATVDTDVDMPDSAGSAVAHSYNVDWLVNDVVVAGVPNPCLRDVSVRVSWSEEDAPASKTLQLRTRRYNWGDPSC